MSLLAASVFSTVRAVGLDGLWVYGGGISWTVDERAADTPLSLSSLSKTGFGWSVGVRRRR